MDVQALHDCFVGTLQADQVTRHQAELSLKQAEKSNGFLSACMDILSEENVNPVVKKSCAIYFKNRITRHWVDVKPETGINDNEKNLVKHRLVSLVISSPMDLRTLLFPILSTILSYNYPDSWPEFLPNTIGLLTNLGDLKSVYAGLLCFSEVARSYRWKKNDERKELEQLIPQVFPNILNIGNSIITSESHGNYESGEMVKLILKIYKFVTYHDLPLALQQQQAVVDWCTFHVNVINLKLPQTVMDLDPDDRRLHPWVKSQKWAFANLYRLSTRYASKSLSEKFQYNDFKKFFNEGFIPELLKVYFNKIGQWCNNEVWISDDSLYYLVIFLENCIVQKDIFKLIKPHLEVLIKHFIFPLLCPSEDTLDLFENDPTEYIHKILDVYEETNAPDMAVISLLYTLVEKKTKSSLEPILQFCYTTLTDLQQKNQDDIEVAKKIEGVLRIIGSISHKLSSEKSPFYPQMESFLNSFVFVHFNSKFPFLRARTCEVASKFSEIKLQNPDVLHHGVMSAFDDVENLPVQLEGALALQAFIGLPSFKEALGTVIVPTMHKLLELSNKVDNDSIAAVIQEFVESFAEQLQPFGVELMTKLSEQLMRLLVELEKASDTDVDDIGELDATSDKEMAALGLINTMVTVLLSFESSVDIVFKLEECFAPCVLYIFDKNMDNYFSEARELVENSSFLTRTISPTLWTIFGSLMGAFENGLAMYYIHELLPCLNNYLVYGSSKVITNKEFSQYFYYIFDLISKTEDVGRTEIICGAELAQTFILSLQSESRIFIPNFIRTILSQLNNTEFSSSLNSLGFIVNMLEVIIAGLIYDTEEVLRLLIQTNSIAFLFTNWFKFIPKLARVYDLKLSVLGLLSLTSIPASSDLQQFLIQIYPDLGTQLVILLSKLPEAIKSLTTKREKFSELGFDDDDDYYEYSAGGGNDDSWEDDDDDESGTRSNDDYLAFLSKQSAEYGSTNNNNGASAAAAAAAAIDPNETDNAEDDDDDDDFYANDDDDDVLDEDPLSNNPLDSINIFEVFKNSFVGTQQYHENVYRLIVSKLGDNEKKIIQDVITMVTNTPNPNAMPSS
ncbi:hypothetical protein PACTADRAFT_51512 [Pachysolen tannophilus NRRL Y-2460]|uniref:Importin N-terminal domain-containing protein n=1 Tax=Pachysolen tannophilus NRRL Y-2460 TaxID=669874 RepID=A0A1E4TPS0_PACTA|nr:hypothetical protein PACTADRAFT_51512 [Pachysolen tannophilus NRRL Y-2460]